MVLLPDGRDLGPLDARLRETRTPRAQAQGVDRTSTVVLCRVPLCHLRGPSALADLRSCPCGRDDLRPLVTTPESTAHTVRAPNRPVEYAWVVRRPPLSEPGR